MFRTRGFIFRKTYIQLWYAKFYMQQYKHSHVEDTKKLKY